MPDFWGNLITATIGAVIFLADLAGDKAGLTCGRRGAALRRTRGSRK